MSKSECYELQIKLLKILISLVIFFGFIGPISAWKSDHYDSLHKFLKKTLQMHLNRQQIITSMLMLLQMI
jgi:hypothetical protein